MAKVALVNDKRRLAEFLESLDGGVTKRLDKATSYYTLRKIEAAGYLVREAASVKQERGRRAKMFKVSGKGRSLIGASKGWKRKSA